MRLAPLPSAPAGPPPPRLGCPHEPSPQREAGGLKPSRGGGAVAAGAARRCPPEAAGPVAPSPGGPIGSPGRRGGGEAGSGARWRREGRGGRAAPVTRCVAAQGYAVGRESVK